MKRYTLLCMLGLSLCLMEIAASAASADPPPSDNLLPRTPLLIQPGSNQLLLGVTDDNFAVYQQGQSVYVTALRPGARRREIATVPNTNVAQILQVGKVAMLWTDPQRSLPGFGVSPLVIWSAAGGPRRISENSAVGLVATDASPDGLQVLYTTNTTPDGLRGDLAVASVLSSGKPRLLLRNLRLNFPFDACRPLAAFVGPPGRAVPTAAYCDGEETTATLSRWVRGQRIDLIKNIATPLPFTLESNPQQTEFFVRLAGSSFPVVVTDQGEIRGVDVVSGTQGFVTDRGTAVYSARPSTTAPIELRLAARGAGPITVAVPFAFAYAKSYNFASYSKRPTPSADGRLALFASTVNPATGLGDIQLLDLRTGSVTPIDSQPTGFGGIDVFTADSNYALYFSDFNLSAGLSALFAANRAGVTRQISDDNSVVLNLATTGSLVVFNDRPLLNSAPAGTFALTQADLRIVDAARWQPARVIAAKANLFYFSSHRRQGLVFTTDTALAPGLYLAAANL
jgi:hypothetical protein